MACTLFAQKTEQYRSQLIIGQRQQRGVGLLEVLIALVLLTIGALGAVRLQLKALQYTTSAEHTTQASFLAYDMLERMRANAAHLSDYAISVNSGCSDSPATVNILATDRQDFIRAVSCLLPGGYGEIRISGNYAAVTIGWSEARLVADGNTEFVVGSRILGEL